MRPPDTWASGIPPEKSGTALQRDTIIGYTSKLYTYWNETETKQLRTVVKLFCINFLSMIGQFKPLVFFFS